MGEDRIKLNDSLVSAVMKLVEGNPGATQVCLQLLEKGGEIDSNSALGGMGSVLMLDTFRIYGPRIWMLYKDVCGCDLRKVVAVLRSVQLGHTHLEKVQYAIDHMGEGLDLNEIHRKVCEELPQFSKGGLKNNDRG